MSANIDVLEAIKTRWAATSVNSTLPATRVYTGKAPATTLPYCILEVRRDREPDYQAPRTSGDPFLDYRRAKFTVYADSAPGVDTALDAIESSFNTEFTVPNGTMLDWRNDTPDGTEEDKERSSAGEAVYFGSAEYVLTQERMIP